MIFRAYCVGKLHNMLPWWYYDNGSIRYTICYLGSIMKIGAYCEGKVHNMLAQQYYDNGSILCR